MIDSTEMVSPIVFPPTKDRIHDVKLKIQPGNSDQKEGSHFWP